jgi:hypothetical protein
MGIGKGKKEELGKGDNRPTPPSLPFPEGDKGEGSERLNRAKIDREELLLIIDIAADFFTKGMNGKLGREVIDSIPCPLWGRE